MDFKELLRLARRRWKTIVSFCAAGLIAGAALSFAATPQYQSTAKVFISTDTSDAGSAFYAGAFASQRVASYAQLATSGELMQRVIKRLNLNLTPGQLASKITATVPTSTVNIDLDVTDPDPRTAQHIAEAEAEEFTAYLSELETPTGKTTSPVKATITDRADFNGNPVSPQTTLNIVIGAVLGLLIGAGFAVMRDLLDTSVKTPDDIASVTDSPVMAHVQYDPDITNTPLVIDSGSHSARNEAFRLLRTNLQFLDLDQNPKSFVISSAVPGEGKTSTSTNLAIALSQAGKKVLLVDGDLRRPRVAALLGLESAVGLTTVLVGRSDLESSIQRHSSGVHFLSSGPVPPNPTEILQSRATHDLLKLLRSMYDVVIIDAPPLLPVADAAILATHVDGAILVVRYGKTTKDQLRHGLARLQQVGARQFGVVVNMTPRRGRGYGYDYDYGYGYGYQPLHSKSAS